MTPGRLAAAADARAKARAVLVDGHPFMTTLAVWAHGRFGDRPADPADPDDGGWPHWHPETLLAECRDELGAALPPPAADRLHAAALVLGTDRVRAEPAAFQAVANCLLGGDPAAAEPADAHECVWAMAELNLLDPPDPGEPAWSPAVERYVRAALARDGYRRVPPEVAPLARLGGDDPPFPALPDPDERAFARAAADAREADLGGWVMTGLRQLFAQVAALPDPPAGDLSGVRARAARLGLGGRPTEGES